MKLVAHAASVLSCVDASGQARSIADKIAFGICAPASALQNYACTGLPDRRSETIGRVHSLGTFSDAAVRAQLIAALGETFASALRNDFEWYRCRGAFFHNDAHYDARLFGVWCITGPAADLVFPRAAVRLACTPGSIAVFDPFEVHGVLLPSAQTFSADDYKDAEPTALIGFEIDLTPAVADTFGIQTGITGRVLSSRTRIAATSGALDAY